MTQIAPGRVRTALLSVFDKTGIVELARGLVDREVRLLASGGTARTLTEAGVPVTPVEEYTGADEILGGRVKTLHPRIHAGLLADRRDPQHMGDLEAHGHAPIDMVVCNLYPFESLLAKGGSEEQLVETIDIGGPTMVRAAAKNAAGGVTVVTDPSDYEAVLDLLREEGEVSWEVRCHLAAKAFRMTADLDGAVAMWWEQRAHDEGPFPYRLRDMERERELRYGENPHQKAALYLERGCPTGVARGLQLQGKELSYNNYLDLDGAYRTAWLFERPACAVVKHTNPCGLAEADDQAGAFEAALAGDPLSAFGSVLGFNRPLEEATAEAIKASKLFVECIAAPGFTEGARRALARRDNLRLVEVPPGDPSPTWATHRIGGGLLLQVVDPGLVDQESWEIVTEVEPEKSWRDELAFAVKAVMSLKSNAIAITRGGALVGAGMGLTSRVDACKLALEKAGERARGAVLASDAFFPFDDCVRLAAAAGVRAIVQPGGSKRDAEVIAAAEELGIPMVFTGRRHFRH